MASTSAFSLQLLLDLFRQDLPQFDAPLIERVDIPYRAFSESYVLIIGDKGAESSRSDFLSQNRRRGPVSDKCLMWNQGGRNAFSENLVGSFAYHQGFGLREEVRRKHALMLSSL